MWRRQKWTGPREEVFEDERGRLRMLISGLEFSTWKRELKLPWREAGPPEHHDHKSGSDQ